MRILSLIVTVTIAALLASPGIEAKKRGRKGAAVKDAARPTGIGLLLRPKASGSSDSTSVSVKLAVQKWHTGNVTYANFDSIRIGDPFGRVQALLGDGEQIRQYQQDGETYSLFEYKSNDGMGYVTVWLKGTVVETKDQIGLHPPRYPNSLLPDPEE